MCPFHAGCEIWEKRRLEKQRRLLFLFRSLENTALPGKIKRLKLMIEYFT